MHKNREILTTFHAMLFFDFITKSVFFGNLTQLVIKAFTFFNIFFYHISAIPLGVHTKIIEIAIACCRQ